MAFILNTPGAAASSALGLGLDVGGSSARWALADRAQQVVAEGELGGFSGLQLASATGRELIQQRLEELARAVGPHGTVGAVCAGITGFDGDAGTTMAAMTGAELDVPIAHIQLFNDIELAHRASFRPGEGYLVYAGTGSVAAYIDAQGEVHRAGGRGGLIDDGGSGYWIATQALRLVWRSEDEQPGAWQRSPLARALFEHIGGNDWAATRNWVYGASRGQLGQLALAVARAAGEDPLALALLQSAGVELARLAQALLRRHGVKPIALAGRVFELHRAVEDSLRQALKAGRSGPVLPRATLAAHQQAARLAVAGLQAPPLGTAAPAAAAR